MKTKQCRQCDDTKPVVQFLTCPRNGHMPTCKPCCSGASVDQPTRWWDEIPCTQCGVAQEYHYLDDAGVCVECGNLNRLEAKRLEEEAE